MTSRENLIKFAQTIRNLFSKLVKNVNTSISRVETTLTTALDAEAKARKAEDLDIRSDVKDALSHYWRKTTDTSDIASSGPALEKVATLTKSISYKSKSSVSGGTSTKITTSFALVTGIVGDRGRMIFHIYSSDGTRFYESVHTGGYHTDDCKILWVPGGFTFYSNKNHTIYFFNEEYKITMT